MSGNVVDWNTVTWNAENLEEIELELETIQERDNVRLLRDEVAVNYLLKRESGIPTVHTKRWLISCN